jgi:hypothetical protein
MNASRKCGGDGSFLLTAVSENSGDPRLYEVGERNAGISVVRANLAVLNLIVKTNLV